MAITEGKRNDREPRAEKSDFRSLVESSSDILCLVDSCATILLISPSVEQLLGWQVESLVGRSIIELLHPDDAPIFVESFQVQVEVPGPGPTLEVRMRHRDGSWRILETRATTRVEDTIIQGIVLAASDITDRRRTEIELETTQEQLRSFPETLQQRVAERTNELTNRAAELEAANQELESFSYSVSHELRAPLRAIDGFSRILLESCAPVPPESQHYLSHVSDNIQEMRRLIDSLLVLSRLSRKPLKMQAVETGDLVREVLADLAVEHEGRRVEISVGTLPPCEADPILLKQVFVNLLANAYKFSRECEPALIHVGSQRATGSGSIYWVRDNGVGFDMQYAASLFGVFQRFHRQEEYAGTGLGLAIVKRIIHRHGGRVWAEAESNKGATFYFTLGEGTSATEKQLEVLRVREDPYDIQLAPGPQEEQR